MAQLISIREAANEAGVSIGYINQLIKSNTLAGQKIGNQWAIDRASFDAWLIKTGRKKPEQAETPARAEA